MWLMRIIDDDILSAEDKLRHMRDIVQGNVKTSWLLRFDADAWSGRGVIKRTQDRAEAKRFASFSDVIECWKTQSTVRPLRPDGKPNRPLTAYSIEPVEIPDH
jgi:hypothetical protein